MKRKFFNRDFTLLWLGKSVSQLGDGAGFIGLMWYVASQTGSAGLLGMMAALRTTVGIVVAPFAGVLADRISKKLLIVGMDLLRAIVYGEMAYLIHTGSMSPTWLLSLVTLNALASGLFAPAISASVPRLVPKDDLPKANSLLQITGNVVSICSYTAGGMLAALLGAPLLLLLDGISFFLSAVSEVFIDIPDVRVASQSQRTGRFIDDLKAGVEYVKGNRVVLGTLKVAAVLNFFFAPVFVLLPKFVQADLGGSPSLFGYLMAGSMAGTLGASLMISFTKVLQKNRWAVIHGITIQSLLTGFALLTPGLAETLRVVLMGFSGFFNGVVNIYFLSVIQQSTAPEHLGKVFGVLDTVCMSLQPISQATSGLVGDRVDLFVIYSVCILALVGGGVTFCRIPGLKELLTPGAKSEENDSSGGGKVPVTAG